MIKLNGSSKKKSKKALLKSAQGVIEYVLVFTVAVVVMYFFATRFDFADLRNFAVFGIFNNRTNTIVIPPMTE